MYLLSTYKPLAVYQIHEAKANTGLYGSPVINITL